MKNIILIVLLFLLIPSVSFSETYVVKENQRLEIDSVDTDNDTVQFFADDRKSFCCAIWSEKNDAVGINFAGFSSGVPSEQISVVSNGATTPIINVSTPDGINFPARRCFTYNEDLLIVSGQALVTMTLGPSSSTIGDVKVHCKETTLYGGFNTLATDFNFIEITNNLNRNVAGESTVQAVIRARGTIADAEVLNKTVNVPARKRVDVDVHSAAPSDFGPIVITHNGPPGALTVRLVKYKITSQSPLEFQPVLVIPFHEGKGR